MTAPPLEVGLGAGATDAARAGVEQSGGFAGGEGEELLRRGGAAEAHLLFGDLPTAIAEARACLGLMKNQAPVAWFIHPGVSGAANVLIEATERARRAKGADAALLGREAADAVKHLAGFAKMHPFAVPTSLASRGRLQAVTGAGGAARTLKRAIESAHAAQMPWEAARAELDLAALVGDDPGPRLDRAEATALRIGAQPLLQRIRDARNRLRRS